MKQLSLRRFFVFLPLVLLPVSLRASPAEAVASDAIVHQMVFVVLQLGVIIFAARIGGVLASRLRQPAVLGELVAGIVIGPHLLGTMALPSFPEGLFPIPDGQTAPVSPELYAFSTVASIILLFMAGLETDVGLLFRYSVAGLVVGAGGVVVSFLAGVWVTAVCLHLPLTAPQCLFMGAITTATSVGVTARVLQETRTTDTPEGVTILAAAVIDDVFGIIVLAVVIGVAAVLGGGSAHGVPWGHIGGVAAKAVLVWIGFTAAGLVLSDRIASLLKRAHSLAVVSVLALGLGLVLAGVFEKAGLAMVIGAYVMGLVLSRTDLRYVIAAELRGVAALFVPVFFTVSGMFVNVASLLSPRVALFGLGFAAVSIAAKVIGCGGAALLVGFNRLGAGRIGLGMSPRSEVALIIAGTGLSYHVLDQEAFGATVVMVLLSVLVTPPLLAASLRFRKPGTREDLPPGERRSLLFNFPSEDLASLLASKVVEYYRHENFFVHPVEDTRTVYHLNRDRTHIVFRQEPRSLLFEAGIDDMPLVRTVVYEALADLQEVLGALKHAARPEVLVDGTVPPQSRTKPPDLHGILIPAAVSLDLRATDKRGVITELIGLLVKAGRLADLRPALHDVLLREETISTGLQDGVAMPHARTAAVKKPLVAVGIKRGGVDFQSLDSKPSEIIILVLSPLSNTSAHIRLLAALASALRTPEQRQRLLDCRTPDDVVVFFGG